MRVDSNSIGQLYSPAGKKPQWGFFRCAARGIHPAPTKRTSVSKYTDVFLL